MFESKDKQVILILTVFIFFFLIISGTMTSGYHFVDDHEIIKINDDLKTLPVGKVLEKYINEDLYSTLRFRPLYYFLRVIKTVVFGTNFFLWSVLLAFVACLTFTLSYMVARKLSFTVFQSVVFLIITFAGPQFAVWWRLGPGESSGMMFLSAGFFLMVSNNGTGRDILFNILSILFLGASTLCKESFILIIPGLIVFKIWYESQVLFKTPALAIRRNLIFIVLMIIITIELIFIKKVTILNAGSSQGMIDTLKGISHVLVKLLQIYFPVVSGLIIIFFLQSGSKRSFHFEPLYLVLFLTFLIPNVIMYRNSEMTERYLLPSSLGIAFLYVSVLRKILREPVRWNKVAFSIILISLIPFFAHIIDRSAKFTKNGRETKSLLSGIAANLGSEKDVLVVVDPVEFYEYSVSLKTYLNCEFKIPLYAYIIGNEPIDNEEVLRAGGLPEYFEGRLFSDLKEPPGLLIFFDKDLCDQFFSTSGLEARNYIPVEDVKGSYTLLKILQN